MKYRQEQEARWESWDEKECMHFIQKDPNYLLALLRYAQIKLHSHLDLVESQQIVI